MERSEAIERIKTRFDKWALDDEEESGNWIIGTSKESIRKIVENSCKDAIKYAEEMLNKSMAEFE